MGSVVDVIAPQGADIGCCAAPITPKGKTVQSEAPALECRVLPKRRENGATVRVQVVYNSQFLFS
jgi:hypothetical protein